MPEMSDEEWAELERLCSLPENELNVELAALGIDPIEFEKQSLEFVAKLSTGAGASKFGA